MLRSNAVADVKTIAGAPDRAVRTNESVLRFHNYINTGAAPLAMDDIHGGETR